MFIKLFRSSYLVHYVIYFLLAGILWIGSFIKPGFQDVQVDPYLNPGYFFIINLLGENKLISTLISFLCVVAGGLLFNYILVKNSLVPKNTLIASLVFLVFMSHSASLLLLHPALIAAILLIIVLHNLFQVYDQEDAYPQVFNSGFLIGIASLVYFPALYFLLYVWLSFIVFRLYMWREWVIVLFGFLTPYLFLWTYYFWDESLTSVFQAYMEHFSNLALFRFNYEFSTLNFIITAFIVMFFLWAFFLLIGDLNEKIITVRKRYWSVLWMFFVSIFTYFISLSFYKSHQVLVLIPTAIVVAYGFSRIKKNIWVELSFGIFLILVVINNLVNS